VPVHVGGDILPPVKTHHVEPIYPGIRSGCETRGAVLVEFTIDTRGRVADARVIRSSPAFDAAALAAVRQWTFAPTILGGRAFSVITNETIGFWP
jgi:protein TonB